MKLDTVSAVPPSPPEAASGAGRPPGWFAAVRFALAHRPDTEHEVAYGRIVFMIAATLMFALGAPDLGHGLLRVETLVCIAVLACSLAFLVHITLNPEISVPRRYTSIVFDQAVITFLVKAGGELGPWIVPLYMLVSTGNSLRFGRDYGLVAALVGAAGFYLVTLSYGSFWQQHPQFAGAIIVTMLVVPAYVALLGHRMEMIHQQYRNRARKMRKAATEDALTGLHNRAYFRRQLALAVQRAQSVDAGEPFAILFIDLDGFKGVNDTFGHHVGDRLLKHVARAVKEGVRGSDIVARLGGDEFAIILRGLREVEIAERIGNGIVQRVKAISRVEGHAIRISCSAGLTMVPAPLEPSKRIEDLMARADYAMYQAKRSGKNQLYRQAFAG